MKVLITGASGLLGRGLLRAFKDAGHEVSGTCLSRIKNGLTKMDLQSATEIQKVIQDAKPDVIIHSAAERRNDECERDTDKAMRINAEATAMIGAIAHEMGAWVLFISTHEVFDGSSGKNYSPDDPMCPVSAVGRSKAAGERLLTEATGGDCGILRVGVLYGPLEKIGESGITVQNPHAKSSVPDYEVLTKAVFPRTKPDTRVT